MDFAELKQRLTLYEKLMRLDKPIGTLLLLWPTFWALWLATEGQPHILLVWIFALGTLLMRSAGCVINDYADREFDPHVERTQRAAAGRRHGVRARSAGAICRAAACAPSCVALPIMRDVWKLTLVALFLAASYPFTKRFFALPQAYLGVAFGFRHSRWPSPPLYTARSAAGLDAAGWRTSSGPWPTTPEYAMVDREDDLKIGIRTAAITFGRFDVMRR
jgi:4-hydroxybenzoate polyprenyltransferase